MRNGLGRQSRHTRRSDNRPNQQRGGGNGRSGRQSGGQRHSHAAHQADTAPPLPHGTVVEGILAIPDERRDGQLRDPAHPLRPVPGNVSVPKRLIQQLSLRPGLLLKGRSRGHMLDVVDTIEGETLERYQNSIPLYDAVAIDPHPMIRLEHDPAELTTRVIDIVSPVGFGQRGLIVAPPRTGKTILLQNIARGIHANYPNVELVLLLVDERPEEVTDMRRNVPGTVYASSNDNTVDKHLDLAQLIIERCKRRAEYGHDVIVLMDSLTRTGRAFNVGGPSGGKTMSGGLDSRAMEIPRKLFGAARKLENGGSLTILATCLIDTGSRMDQVIFEEFKGTGNMELTLDRNLSNQRVYPAINLSGSGTRKEEKLLNDKQLLGGRSIRRHLMNMQPTMAMKALLEALQKHKTNQSLFESLKS